MTSTIKVDTISENTSANGVAVDGVTLKDGGIAATLASTITTADNTDTLTLISTDTDAAAGPNLHLYRNQGTDEGDNDVLGQIKFSGRNDNAQDVLFYRQDVQSSDVSDGAEDAQVRHLLMINGSETEFLRMNPTGFIFNEGGIDIDTRIESSGNANMLFVDGGNNRVGIANNDPAFDLDVRKATSTTMRVGPTGTSGDLDGTIIINNGGSGDAMLRFDYEGNVDRARIGVTTSGQALQFFTAGNTERMRINSDNSIRFATSVNLATGAEASPDTNPGGITLNQGATDGAIMTFKSSDIAHGITNDAETDTYATIGKAQGATGGLQIKVMTEALDSERLVINTNGGGDLITTKSASGGGAIHIGVNNRNGSGTNVTNVNSDGNLLVIRNFTNTRFIFDAEGTFHSDVGTATYDEYEDAHLVRAMDLSTSTKGLIASKFDDFVKYNHEDLAAARIVGREEDGTPNSMVNWTAMSQLHNGAIWQQYEKTQRLTQAMYKLAIKTLGKEEADKLLDEEEIKLLN